MTAHDLPYREGFSGVRKKPGGHRPPLQQMIELEVVHQSIDIPRIQAKDLSRALVIAEPRSDADIWVCFELKMNQGTAQPIGWECRETDAA